MAPAALAADPAAARRRAPARDSAAGSDPGAKADPGEADPEEADPGEGSSPADCALRIKVAAIAQHPDGRPDRREAVRVDVADHQLRVGSSGGEDLTER